MLIAYNRYMHARTHTHIHTSCTFMYPINPPTLDALYPTLDESIARFCSFMMPKMRHNATATSFWTSPSWFNIWVKDTRIHHPESSPNSVTGSEILTYHYRAWSGGVVKSFAQNNPPNHTARMRGSAKALQWESDGLRFTLRFQHVGTQLEK